MKHFLWLFCLSWSIFALPLAAQTDGKAMKRQPHDAFSTLKTDSLLRDTVKTDATLQTVAVTGDCTRASTHSSE